MAEDDNVLFIRGGEESSSEDVWDDSALIKAYDKAISLAKEEVSKRMGLDNENSGNKQKKSQSQRSSRQAQKSQRKWVVGSPCRAIYSDDGELYEAIITKIFDNTGTCMVKFIGYNNEEKVELSSLIASEGLQSQVKQQKEAASGERNVNFMDCEETPKMNGIAENQMDCNSDEFKSFKNLYDPGLPFNSVMPPAPPLPPQLMARLPENDADALSSMLMSWYISGFHTGYYHGLKQAQSGQRQRKT